MQYLKIQGLINDPAFVEENESRQNSRKISHRISMRTYEFNEKLCKRGYIFVSSIEDSLIDFGFFAENDLDIDRTISRYIKHIGLNIQDIKKGEITLSAISYMLSCACRHDYIDDDDAVLEMFGLDVIRGRWGRYVEYGEVIVNDTSEKELLEEVGKYISEETLKPELERILSTKVSSGRYGHPVHYFVETDDQDLMNDFCTMILQGLRLSGRLKCKRYSYVNISPNSDFSAIAYESLYKSSSGSAIVVRLRTAAEQEDEHASAERENIGILCEMMKKYRNRVLTIFCFPRECAKLKEIFYEGLGNVCFMDIREDFAKNDKARSYLKKLARENRIRPDKALTSRVEENEGYLSTQLRDMFDEWYDAKLRNKIFPQYKDARSVKKELLKASPKGSAYDELNEMIGIAEAKKVIMQAIDYYKAQKIFKEKGMGEDHIAMHMCFTGSPGTCKTSTARLFAEIMKDNGLLSKGHLVELTANELKGKYVGWTGPQVKKAFERAKGGVLFLDEAYSLNANDSFAEEALANICAEMENHRGEVVCIFGGYTKEMEIFLQKNPGLRSRIAFHVQFKDYSTEELCEISQLIARKKGRRLTDEALEKLRILYETAKNEPDFGNGRFCRNVIEKAKLAQSSRLVAMDYDSVTKADIETLTADDIEMEIEKKTDKTKIGFCA